MKHSRSIGRGRLGIFLGLSAVIVATAFWSVGTRAAGAGGDSRLAKLSAVGFKFEGSRTCAGSKCHDTKPVTDPLKQSGDELTKWNDADHHHTAFDTLKKPASGDIGKKLNIAEVTTSEKC